MEFMSGTRTRVRTETTPWRGAALVRTRGLALFVAERVNLNLEATGGSRELPSAMPFPSRFLGPSRTQRMDLQRVEPFLGAACCLTL